MILNHLIDYMYERTHSTVCQVGFVIGLSVTLVLNGISASKQEEALSTSLDVQRYNISKNRFSSPNICSSINLLFLNYLELLDNGPRGLKNVGN
jgi:hypothetical protein